MCIWIRSYKFAMVFLLHLNVKFTLSINIRNSFCRNQMYEISNMATCIIETYLDFYFVYVSSNVRTQIRRQLSLSLRALSHAHTFSQTIDIFSTLLTTWTCFVGETSCNQLQLRKCLQIWIMTVLPLVRSGHIVNS